MLPYILPWMSGFNGSSPSRPSAMKMNVAKPKTRTMNQVDFDFGILSIIISGGIFMSVLRDLFEISQPTISCGIEYQLNSRGNILDLEIVSMDIIPSLPSI